MTDPAIAIPPSPAGATAGPRGPKADRSVRVERRIAGLAPAHLALGGLLVLSLLVRLWGVKQGLPYSYNSDEAAHFLPKAVGFASGDLNPHYFLNPSAYSYLLYIVLAAWFGGGQGLHHAFVTDPTAVYILARVVAALLSTAAVWLIYLGGSRLFGRWAGVVAAAVLGLAFLPVFYSHLALNDAPTLGPVALALWGTARIVGRTRRPGLDYVLAGLGVGLAAGTKYTGGIVLVCLLGAFAGDVARGPGWSATRRLGGALLVAVVAFVATNPYAALDLSTFRSGISYQASQVGLSKLGTQPDNGWVYYLWTFTWGLGWGPALAGLGGGALLVIRRRFAVALTLLPAPLIFMIYMGAQERFFGRWLMPIFPIVALLAGHAAVQAVRWVGRARRLATVAAGVLAGALLLAQSVVADIHDDAVLSRPDTRNLARAWMVRHIPPGSKVVVEPIVPPSWGRPWRLYPTALAALTTAGRPRPGGRSRPIHLDQYESHLFPSLLSRYQSDGYCWVLTGSQQSGRAFVRPDAAPGAVAYYAALARRGRLVYRVSPLTAGGARPEFSFDWSFDYYPSRYRLPGPEIRIYRLSGGKCGP